MKHKLFTLIVTVLASNMALAQAPQDSVAVKDTTIKAATIDEASEVIFPRNLIGVRGGANFSDMIYSYDGIDRYDHHTQLQGMIGLFGHFHLGKSNFAIRPEVSYVGRADSLDWLDVRYSLKARYLDLRLPLTYNIRFKNSCFSPYLMVVPQANLAFGGKVYYKDEVDYPYGVTAPITKADINGLDLSVMAGLGFDYLIRTKGIPVLFSIEAGYNWGLLNTFAEREILNNPNIVEGNRSIIGNPFFGAELWQETRHNRGLEVAMRIALPIDNSWKQERKPLEQKIDTVYVVKNDSITITDTIYVDTNVNRDTIFLNKPVRPINPDVEYVRKDCYSFAEMYSFMTLGIDVSDKRMCLFNINFDFDKYKLRPESKSPLDEVAMMMKAFPEMRIKIIGHTDSKGSDDYNATLSQNRAKSVARYLHSKGVAMDRMETEGFGEKYPIDTNDTDEGRFNNRRVEIEVLNVGLQLTDPPTTLEK